MGDADASIYSISGSENPRCRPPAVVITHDSDSLAVNPSSGEGLLGYTSSTMSLASPRHTKIHPSERTTSLMAVFSPEGQLLGNDPQMDHPDMNMSEYPEETCWSSRARRTAVAFLLTVITCATWTGTTHLMKRAMIMHLVPLPCNCSLNESDANESFALFPDPDKTPFKAPFLCTWFFTACNCIVFPIYLCGSVFSRRTRTTPRRSILESLRRFREKGLTVVHFVTRSIFFCVLWVGTNHMLLYALERLDATALIALLASSTSFVYLLSWVILHEQFVGIRIVAVILCNTGIALLAYMDGVSRTSTLGGVVLAAAAAAGLAVFKVLFKKLIGRVTIAQLSIFLTLLGLLNVLLLWPISLAVYFLKSEIIIWTELPYIELAGSVVLIMIGNILGNFDIAHNYELFLNLGFVASVPVSAVLDVHLYKVVFEGMKLAGVLLISIGFLMVLLPDNWPDYITRLIRWRCRKCPKAKKPADATQPRSRHIFMRPS